MAKSWNLAWREKPDMQHVASGQFAHMICKKSLFSLSKPHMQRARIVLNESTCGGGNPAHSLRRKTCANSCRGRRDLYLGTYFTVHSMAKSMKRQKNMKQKRREEISKQAVKTRFFSANLYNRLTKASGQEIYTWAAEKSCDRSNIEAFHSTLENTLPSA